MSLLKTFLSYPLRISLHLYPFLIVSLDPVLFRGPSFLLFFIPFFFILFSPTRDVSGDIGDDFGGWSGDSSDVAYGDVIMVMV